MASHFKCFSRVLVGVSRGMSKQKLKSSLLVCVTETTLLIEGHKDWRTRAEIDVVNLLRLGQTQRALLWVEFVIKEQNTITVLFMVQRILHFLIEKAIKIYTHRTCPSELREPIACIVYAAPRCGDCTELRNLSSLLQSWFMKHTFDITSEANQQMVHLLSTKQPSLEKRLEVMKAIARTYGIDLNPEKISISEFD